MADLSKRYPRTYTRPPPAMPAGDWEVWQAFIAQRGYEWQEYAYDVEIHGGPTPILDQDPRFARMGARLLAKRIDAVGFRAAGATLFEARTRAAWQSVGQLLGYRDLIRIDYPDIVIEGAMIVTDWIDDQVAGVATRAGLQIYRVTW